MRSLCPRPTLVPLFAAALAVLLPAAAHGYINTFKSRAEYEKYLTVQERIRNPVTAEDYCARGAARRWDTAGALFDYSTAIELDPSLLDGYLGRGYYRWRSENYAGALADFEEGWRRTRSAKPAQRLLVIYTFCPDKKLRSPAKAVEMAREIGREGFNRELLAESLARAGDFKAAAREQAQFLDILRTQSWRRTAIAPAERRLEAYRRRQLPESHPDWQRLGLPLPDEE
jgi:tetratricopeptide (TPR) repeat protein